MLVKKFSLLFLVLLHCLLFWKINLFNFLLGKMPLWDFDVYYQTAADVRNGAHPYQLKYMQTAGPPLVIAPFLPFTFLPLPVARTTILLISLAAVLGTSILLAKKIFPKAPMLFALLLNLFLLTTFQPRFNFILGQPNLIIMLLITLVLTTTSRGNTGLLFASITLIKTHYAVAWIALLKKSFKSITIGVVAVIVIGLVTLPIIKPIFYFDYLSTRLSKHIAEPLIIHDVGYYNQSLRATLARLSIGESFGVISVVLLLSGGWYVFKSGDQASGFLLSLLVSPIVWQHYIVITYPIIFLTLLAYAKRKKLPWHIVVAAVLLFAHIPWLHEKGVSFWLGILASHYYLGVVLLFYSRFELYRSRIIAK